MVMESAPWRNQQQRAPLFHKNPLSKNIAWLVEASKNVYTLSLLPTLMAGVLGSEKASGMIVAVGKRSSRL